MATRVVMAIQDRLVVVVSVAEQVVEAQPTQVPRNVLRRLRTAFSGNLWQMAVRSAPGMQQAGCWTGSSDTVSATVMCSVVDRLTGLRSRPGWEGLPARLH